MTDNSNPHGDPLSHPPYAQQPPAPPQYQPYPPYPLPAPTNGMAIASLVLGIVRITVGWILVGIPSVLAVVFGHVALSTISRTGQQGKGMAIAGPFYSLPRLRGR
ncbi:MAG: DUF4190 domain-containing protein, partial [Jiangellaceae bacterium]